MTKRSQIRYNLYNDYYILLDVKPSATADEIMRAFRRRAKQFHPDRNPDKVEWANEQFQRLNDAYQVLKNPIARIEYDRQRSIFHPSSEPPSWHDLREPFRSSMPPAMNWWAVLRSLPRGPYRYVLVILLFALVGNVSFLLLTQPPSTAATGTKFERTVPPSVVTFITVTPYFFTHAPDPTCDNPGVTITEPRDDFEINNDAFDIRGTATHELFASYTIEIDATEKDRNNNDFVLRWILSAPIYQPVIEMNGLLVRSVSIKNMSPGTYILRLKVTLIDGTVLPACERRITRKI